MERSKMEKYYYTAQEFSALQGISISAAYLKIRKLNAELTEKGYEVLPGKIPIAYVRERYYGLNKKGEMNA